MNFYTKLINELKLLLLDNEVFYYLQFNINYINISISDNDNNIVRNLIYNFS